MSIVALVIAAGVVLVAGGVILRRTERASALADALDMTASTGRSAFADRLVAAADSAVARADSEGALGRLLERADVAARPGEVVAASAAAGVVAALALYVLVGPLAAAAALIAAGLAPGALLRRRAAKRRRQLEEQLPDALSLIASSLTAGHTFLRALQMLCEEAEAPLSTELARVVSATQLGGSPVDALGDMAERLGIADLTWVVQAVRIQQEVGGKLADLLHTLAGFVRSRQELRREVSVLTAEGRISTAVLGGLPVFIAIAIEVINPSYLRPMLHGGGLLVLIAAALSVAAGVVVIRRMVQIEV